MCVLVSLWVGVGVCVGGVGFEGLRVGDMICCVRGRSDAQAIPPPPIHQPPTPHTLTSSTAKANAPWGRLRTNWAPAPRVRMRKLRFCSSVDPLVCRSVLTTLAGCMAVCAQLQVWWVVGVGGMKCEGSIKSNQAIDKMNQSIQPINPCNHLRDTAPASILPQKVSVWSTCSAGMPSRRGPRE